MLRKILIGVSLGLLIVGIGLVVWTRVVFGTDPVRAAVERQLTRALGQPVQVGRAAVSVFPRVRLRLDQVAIGDPARITADQLVVGASLRALVSRRIEQGAVRLTGARIEFPLPAFAFADDSDPAGDDGSAPVEIVSIDEIVIDDATLVSGGRTLNADVEIVPAPDGLVVRKFDLDAGGEVVHVTGRLDDVMAPSGALTITADALALDALLQFAAEFAEGAAVGRGSDGRPSEPVSAPGAPEGTLARSALDLELTVDAARATIGTLLLSELAGQGRVTGSALTLDRVRFGLFDGQYEGALAFALEETPAFRLNATVSGIDMGALMAFAGQPGAVTGRLSGTLDVNGRGTGAAAVLPSARGTARIDLVDGVVKDLGLVRAVVLAGSGRRESEAAATDAPRDEPFSRLGGSFTIASGSTHTTDLRFESESLLLSAAGSMALDGSRIELAGDAQLSEALTAQAGRDLVRYTQEGGRVTLPVTISGSVGAYSVGIDLADLTRRAIINRATEEVQDAIKKGLGGLLGR